SVFGLDEQGLGSLLAASGIGALTVALFFSIRAKTEGLTRIFVLGAAVKALALLVLVSNTNLTMALVALAVSGGALVGASLGAQTLIQHMVLDEYRARVISVAVAISVGGPAFGTLLIGWVAEMTGFRWALAGAAVAVLIVLLLTGWRLLSAAPVMEAEQT
ncbi:MAG: MFS transporter, partial [Rhodospirillales bacterium]|nr:MFS transporter [Rhodospirillales bacterium]